jgi:hypothetical protein
MKLRLVAIVVACISCTSGTETGNPLTAELSVGAHSTDPSVAALAAGDGVVVESAWVALGDIIFFPVGSCDDAMAAEVAFRGPTAVDLVRSVPFQSFEPTQATYCGVEIPLHPIPSIPEVAPPELDGGTMVVTGRRADGTPFRIVSAMVLRLQIRGPMDSFDVEAAPVLLAALDVALWFAGIDLDALAAEPDGTIAIDASRNAATLELFETNVLHSADLHHDVNRNGHVDPGEERVAVHH